MACYSSPSVKHWFYYTSGVDRVVFSWSSHKESRRRYLHISLNFSMNEIAHKPWVKVPPKSVIKCWPVKATGHWGTQANRHSILSEVHNGSWWISQKRLRMIFFFPLKHLKSKNEMLFISMVPPQHQNVCRYGDISSEVMPWYKNIRSYYNNKSQK